MKVYLTTCGHDVLCERRRYGRQTYTWLYIKLDGELTQLGDPWPCVNPARSEVQAAVEYLTQYHPHPSQTLSCFI